MYFLSELVPFGRAIRAGATSRAADTTHFRCACPPAAELDRRAAVQHEAIGTPGLRKGPTVCGRAFARAAAIAGGDVPLARFLAGTPAEMAKWPPGAFTPPMPFFLAMVDINA